MINPAACQHRDVRVTEIAFTKEPDGYGGMRRYLWEIGVCRSCGAPERRRWQVRGHPTDWQPVDRTRDAG